MQHPGDMDASYEARLAAALQAYFPHYGVPAMRAAPDGSWRTAVLGMPVCVAPCGDSGLPPREALARAALRIVEGVVEMLIAPSSGAGAAAGNTPDAFADVRQAALAEVRALRAAEDARLAEEEHEDRAAAEGHARVQCQAAHDLRAAAALGDVLPVLANPALFSAFKPNAAPDSPARTLDQKATGEHSTVPPAVDYMQVEGGVSDASDPASGHATLGRHRPGADADFLAEKPPAKAIRTAEQSGNAVSALFALHSRSGSAEPAPTFDFFDRTPFHGCVGAYAGRRVVVPAVYRRRADAKAEAARRLCAAFLGDDARFPFVRPDDRDSAYDGTDDVPANVAVSARAPAQEAAVAGVDLPDAPVAAALSGGRRFVSVVNEWCLKRRLAPPEYVALVLPPAMVAANATAFVLRVSGFAGAPPGRTYTSFVFARKADAKEDAAARIALDLRARGELDDDFRPVAALPPAPLVPPMAPFPVYGGIPPMLPMMHLPPPFAPVPPPPSDPRLRRPPSGDGPTDPRRRPPPA